MDHQRKFRDKKKDTFVKIEKNNLSDVLLLTKEILCQKRTYSLTDCFFFKVFLIFAFNLLKQFWRQT